MKGKKKKHERHYRLHNKPMWLQNHGLDFKEINLDEGNEREKFMESYPHLRTSPQIFCDGENVGGFTDLIEVDPEDLR